MNQVDAVAVLGGGPAGMASALSLIRSGVKVRVYERYPFARPAGNILNLWPPPIHALRSMGVDMSDIGAPCHTTFRNSQGRVRAEVRLPDDIVEKYGGGFIGLLRPDLYSRMLSAMPDGVIQFNSSVVGIRDCNEHVELTFANGKVAQHAALVGADGIDPLVRKHIWGDSSKRNHDLHIIGGYVSDLDESIDVEPNECLLMHDQYVQAMYTTILSNGRTGYQWWVLEAWPDSKPLPEDLLGHAVKLSSEFSGAVGRLVKATPKENLQRWPIRDRVPLKSWSKGRITLAGDAAHATSPYAAYGAGMSIRDGYFIGKKLHKVDLSNTAAVSRAFMEYEALQLEHTTEQVNQAYFLGKLFHHVPYPFTYLRDAYLDWSGILQQKVGVESLGRIVSQLLQMGRGITPD